MEVKITGFLLSQGINTKQKRTFKISELSEDGKERSYNISAVAARAEGLKIHSVCTLLLKGASFYAMDNMRGFVCETVEAVPAAGQTSGK